MGSQNPLIFTILQLLVTFWGRSSLASLRLVLFRREWCKVLFTYSPFLVSRIFSLPPLPPILCGSAIGRCTAEREGESKYSERCCDAIFVAFHLHTLARVGRMPLTLQFHFQAPAQRNRKSLGIFFTSPTENGNVRLLLVPPLLRMLHLLVLLRQLYLRRGPVVLRRVRNHGLRNIRNLSMPLLALHHRLDLQTRE